MKKEAGQFQEMLESSSRIVGFTGAGVSTESGIADYRSQGGIWEKFQPVYLDEFIADEEKRRLEWSRKQALWASLKPARPGPAHRFFYHLHKTGRLSGLITQNIDGLHEKSGIPADRIVNLHGTGLEIICLDCGDTQPADGFMDRLDISAPSPVCERCGGLLKSNTISFGQSLNGEDLSRAEQLACNCDLFIAAGSTLVVQPAATYPLMAQQSGATLVIITLSDTPLDHLADLVINRPLGDFLSGFIDR